MALATLTGTEIRDWDSFHDLCASELGFPEFYGRNMNAFIDCLTYLDEADGMSRFALAPGEFLELRVTDSAAFRRSAPEIAAALIESVIHVNRRYADRGKPEMVRLVLT
jgi:hypothetical protein